MAIRVVRLGSPRAKGEGIRLGTVRRPPRGVPKAQYAVQNYYDAWLPELAPSAALVAKALQAPWSDKRWQQFVRAYRREMRAPAAQHSASQRWRRYHGNRTSRSDATATMLRAAIAAVLRELLAEAGAALAEV